MDIRGRVLCILLLIPVWAVAAQAGTVLWYTEQEAGTSPYKVRYFVSKDFMRSDDGDDRGDFVLYDRRSKKIFSVVHDERRVLQIDGEGVVPAVPDALDMSVDKRVDEDAPMVAGIRPVTLQLMAGNQRCYMATVLPGLLTDVREAFLEFNRALAVQQFRSLEITPVEFRTPCFLLRYVYATDFSLVHGLPLFDLDESGDRRVLLDYEEDVTLDAGLFALPVGYQVQQPGVVEPADREAD